MFLIIIKSILITKLTLFFWVLLLDILQLERIIIRVNNMQ